MRGLFILLLAIIVYFHSAKTFASPGSCSTGSPSVVYACPGGSTAPIVAVVGDEITIDIQTFFNAPATSIVSVELFDQGTPTFNLTSEHRINDDFFFDGYFSTAGSAVWQALVFDNLGGQGVVDPFGGSSNIFVSVAPAVPEPSTWAMIILGFVGIGAVTYRRRKSVRLAAQ
jgi:hypothetical protein